MERKRQREMALAIVAAALIAAAIWSVRSASAPAPAAQTAGRTSGPAARQAARDPNTLTGIDLQALEAERPEPEDSNRNPFRFKARAPAPRPQTAPSATMPQMPPVPTGPIEPPALPRIPLKFIGLLSSQSDPKVGRVAILSDTRGVYYGKENETIEGRYRILKIGVESIDLAYLDGRGRQTIRLTGQ
jgi:hypothetical protein